MTQKAPILTIHTDGAARGNPGPAAFAYVIHREGAPPVEEAGCLGRATNNQAEYAALVRALEHAARLGTHHRLIIHSDSELMVKQMRGEYRVKDETLRGLYEKARELSARFAGVMFRHVPRSQNSRADQLCNEVLDGRRQPATAAEVEEESDPPPNGRGQRDTLREQALGCLRAAAAAWARGNPSDPAPDAVWDQLCGLLQDRGVVLRRE
ncbi:MAG TPA: ribonuclease HI family protein [Gemmataceae bacterium]|nr:ribonuclease HI family protein [Gemmataceae bacterium]